MQVIAKGKEKSAKRAVKKKASVEESHLKAMRTPSAEEKRSFEERMKSLVREAKEVEKLFGLFMAIESQPETLYRGEGGLSNGTMHDLLMAHAVPSLKEQSESFREAPNIPRLTYNPDLVGPTQAAWGAFTISYCN